MPEVSEDYIIEPWTRHVPNNPPETIWMVRQNNPGIKWVIGVFNTREEAELSVPEVKMDRAAYLKKWKPLFSKYDEGDLMEADLDALIEAEIERGYQEGFSAGLKKAQEAVELGRKVAQAIRK